jgi:hypothetical protein
MPRGRTRPEKKFVQIEGKWHFENDHAIYMGPLHDTQLVSSAPVGICLYPSLFRSGIANTKIRFKGLPADQSANILIGYNTAIGSYWFVGLGGYGRAYVLGHFTPTRGWQAIYAQGSSSQLDDGRVYDLQTEIQGQHVLLTVDEVRVFQYALPSPLEGNQAGLFAFGPIQVELSNFRVSGDKPKAFIVMQFGGPFDDLYRKVISPILGRAGFDAQRADDVFKPGIIIQDIIQQITEADIVIAEITPVNANVFYELGYAHALRKPTILLANRTTDKLPFDVSGHRVIFYDDTIRGKRDIEINLQRHLENVQRDLGLS